MKKKREEVSKKERWTKIVFSLFLISFFLILIKTEKDIGVTYDEPSYFDKVLTLANTSLSFFERFEQFNPPNHGAFMFLLSSMGYLIGKESMDLTSALRLSTMLL